MKDPLKTIEKSMDLADDIHFSGEEEGKIIGARHERDMVSDSWLSKNIRPLLVISFVVLFIVFSTLSAFGIVIEASLLTMLKGFTDIGIMFYFGSRGIEKVAKIAKQDRKTRRLEAKLERRELKNKKYF